MSGDPFERGDVVWHPAPFKERPGERPFLVLSDGTHPFHGAEYAVAALTRTERADAVALGPDAWQLGGPNGESYASPWYLFTIKHADVNGPKGALTAEATRTVARAAASILGVGEGTPRP